MQAAVGDELTVRRPPDVHLASEATVDMADSTL
jgi:hypothetical protein